MIGVALAVQVGGLVDRHAVDETGEVGAVVQVEPAQQVLVGLALAGVDRDLPSPARSRSNWPTR